MRVLPFVRNLLRHHDAFIGAPALINFLASNGAEVHHVTAAPKRVEYFPRNFLDHSGIVGVLWTRPEVKEPKDQFKFDKIMELIRAHPGRPIILIGDDGQKDIEVYDRVARELLPLHQKPLIFIHDLYARGRGQSVLPGQRAFFTFADLAIHLEINRFFRPEQTRVIVELVSAAIASKCPDLQSRVYPFFGRMGVNDLEAIKFLFRVLNRRPEEPAAQNILEHLRGRHSSCASRLSEYGRSS
jgi:hypothetical protein